MMIARHNQKTARKVYGSGTDFFKVPSALESSRCPARDAKASIKTPNKGVATSKPIKTPVYITTAYPVAF